MLLFLLRGQNVKWWTYIVCTYNNKWDISVGYTSAVFALNVAFIPSSLYVCSSHGITCRHSSIVFDQARLIQYTGQK